MPDSRSEDCVVQLNARRPPPGEERRILKRPRPNESDMSTLLFLQTVETGYHIEFAWNSTVFDRMQWALRQFATNERAMGETIYHRLLGHNIMQEQLQFQVPKRCGVFVVWTILGHAHKETER